MNNELRGNLEYYERKLVEYVDGSVQGLLNKISLTRDAIGLINKYEVYFEKSELDEWISRLSKKTNVSEQAIRKDIKRAKYKDCYEGNQIGSLDSDSKENKEAIIEFNKFKKSGYSPNKLPSSWSIELAIEALRVFGSLKPKQEAKDGDRCIIIKRKGKNG